MTTSEKTRRGVQRPMRNLMFSAKSVTRFGTWNVRTLNQCGRFDQLMREFEAYRMDVLGISEVRWTGIGRITRNDGKVFLYSCDEVHHERGVGLVLSKQAADALVGWKPVNDRIISARFQSVHTKTTIVQAYAPTEAASDAQKDAFYEQLQDVLNEAPNHDLKLLIGDLNGLLSPDRRGFAHVVGPFASTDQSSDNGERLRAFCSINGLCIGNTFFQQKRIHKKTWRAPSGLYCNEIDFICINKRWRSALKNVRVYRAADVGSDHFLLRADLQLKFKKQCRPMPVQPFAVERLSDPAVSDAFALSLQNRFNALKDTEALEDQWSTFKQVVTEGAQDTIGRRRGKRKERWIKDKTWTLIDERKKVKRAREQACTAEQALEAANLYIELDRQVKQSCRADKRSWVEQKGIEAQEAADRNDTTSLYRIVRELVGIRRNSYVPVKDKNGKMLLGKEEQDARWVEYFEETLNQPDPPTLFDFDTERQQADLEANMEDISHAEVEAAIKALKKRKAAGIDEISPELLTHGGRSLSQKLLEVCNSCWRSEVVPEDWRKGVIVKLFKKGSPAECSNWRGVTLLSVPGKVFCSVLLRRLRAAVDQRLRENQAGFRTNRSCLEQIFSLRNIIEQSLKYKRQVAINFVDFKKAFDSVHRESLWRILQLYGIPQRFVAIFKNLYLNSSCAIKTDTGTTKFFNILTGVRQGCILSPFLFLIVIDFVLAKSTNNPRYGIPWTDQSRLTDLDFADDIALLAESTKSLQEMTTALEAQSSKVGLQISHEKTKFMQYCDLALPDLVPISVGQQQLTEVDQFTYLGSLIRNDGDSEVDVGCRIGKASAIFNQLRPIWASSTITRSIKLRMYTTIVLPTATYGCEAWKVTVAVTRKLDVFHQRCLRRILRITYLDRITNREVLHRSGMRRLSTIIAERRLRFAGHVLRMDQHRVPKIAFYWKPPGATLTRGRPKTNWRSTFVNDLKQIGITWEQAEKIAADRAQWRTLVALYASQHGKD